MIFASSSQDRATAQSSTYHRDLLSEIGSPQNLPTVIYNDNNGGVCLTIDRHKITKLTRHIAINLANVQYAVRKTLLQFEYKHTKDLTADILSKTVSVAEHVGQSQRELYYLKGVELNVKILG